MTSALETFRHEGLDHLRSKEEAIERLRQQGIHDIWPERRGADIVFGFRYCHFVRPVCVEIERRNRSHILRNVLRDFEARAHQVVVLVPNEAIKRSVAERLVKHLSDTFRDATSIATMAEFSEMQLVAILSRTISTQGGSSVS